MASQIINNVKSPGVDSSWQRLGSKLARFKTRLGGEWILAFRTLRVAFCVLGGEGRGTKARAHLHATGHFTQHMSRGARAGLISEGVLQQTRILLRGSYPRNVEQTLLWMTMWVSHSSLPSGEEKSSQVVSVFLLAR